MISPRLARQCCSVSATTRWRGYCCFHSSSSSTTAATPGIRSEEIDDDAVIGTSSPSQASLSSSTATNRVGNGVCHCPDPPTCPKACANLLHIDRHHVLHPYTSMIDPLPTYPVQSARGVHITLTDGRHLIDGMSSWWAAVHGYRHPILDEAMVNQIQDSMSHVMFGGLTHRPAVELTMRLLQLVNNDYFDYTTPTTTATPTSTTSTTTKASTTLLSSLSDAQLDKMHNDYHFTKVFFSDSGSIAVEVAMKMAIQYWHTTQQQQHQQSKTTRQKKNKFLSLNNGYHGDTFGAMSVCDPINGMHTMFTGVLSNQYFVPSPTGPNISDTFNTLTHIEEILQLHHEDIAAIIIEPIVQGAGGMKFYHPHLLYHIRQLCNTYNVLLIYDEIATGFGRTGTLFAGWQNELSYTPWSSSSLLDVADLVNDDNDDLLEGKGSLHNANEDNNMEDHNNDDVNGEIVYPDIVCLGKALTGGYVTLGATITTNKVANGISSGHGGVFMHGPTFMANPLACAVSLASLNLLLSSPWKERVCTVNKSLITSLSPLAELTSLVKEVRVLGAIGVCELHEGLDRDTMSRVQHQLVNEGVWLRPFGKLLYTMPPFNCEELTKDHVQKIGQAMYNVASKL